MFQKTKGLLHEPLPKISQTAFRVVVFLIGPYLWYSDQRSLVNTRKQNQSKSTMMQDQSVMGHHRQIKLVVVGDGAVGQWMKIMKLLLPVLNGKRPSQNGKSTFLCWFPTNVDEVRGDDGPWEDLGTYQSLLSLVGKQPRKVVIYRLGRTFAV